MVGSGNANFFFFFMKLETGASCRQGEGCVRGNGQVWGQAGPCPSTVPASQAPSSAPCWQILARPADKGKGLGCSTTAPGARVGRVGIGSQ